MTKAIVKKSAALTAVFCAGAWAQCDLSGYKALPGLAAASHQNALEVAWLGERGEQLRASFALRDGQPMVSELAARKGTGKWIVLGRDLSPEYLVTSGKRRLSEQQMAPLRELGIQLTPAVIEREQWNAFWDAPARGHQSGAASQG
jgi:hypothetical protein